MNKINHSAIGDLFSVISDGKAFYEQVATKVGNAEHKALFTRIATAKSEFLKDLPSELRPVTGGVKPAEAGGVVAEFGRLYADVGHLVEEKSLAWVTRLAESEGRIVKMSENILADTGVPAPVRTALTRHLPEMRLCHEHLMKIAPLKKAA